MEVQEESKILLGRILLMINAISETDLLRLMRRKAEESIYDVFLWKEGEFHFIDNELPTADLSQIQQHLAECAPCLRKYDLDIYAQIATISRTTAMFDDQGVAAVVADVDDDIDSGGRIKMVDYW